MWCPVLSRLAKFEQTNLKLVSDLDPYKPDIPEEAQELIHQLCVSFCAQLKYCQDEYTGIVVCGQFGGDTKQVFKALQRNTSVFTEDSLETLKTVVTLTAPNQQKHDCGFDWKPRGNSW